jgi:uncharacterized protein YjiS (DUF1127 family)
MLRQVCTDVLNKLYEVKTMNTQVIDTPEFESGQESEIFQVERKTGLIGKLKSLYVGYREWARYRGAIRELSMMDDSRLADIGIVRGEIRTVVRQAMHENSSRERRSVGIRG